MTKEPQEGYVYILTNPSFKEDWVKIGKSSRPVDVRSKELDNTAVPLPFEIFATMKTAKYGEVEKLVHKTIDRLTDLWSLSAFCGTYLPEEMHNKSESYQGPKYFSYNGKTLWEIRLEREKEC